MARRQKLRTASRAEHDRTRNLARFFELSLDLCCIADLQGYFLTVNSNFSRQLGYTDAELTGRPFLSFIHPDDVESTRAEMIRLREGNEVVAFRNRYRDTHGRYSWFEWTARAIPEEGLVFASARDVTERLRIEQQLIALEQRERAILDNTSAVIYVKDLQGRYQFVNREFERLFHVTQQEAEGKSDFDLFPEDLAAEFQQNDRRVIETKQSLKIEEVAPHADGLHNYLSVKFPLFDATGEAVSIAGISTDISDRVWLQRTNEQLRLAQEVQRRLFPAGHFHVEGFDIHGKVLAASHLCGDYFDFVRRPDGTVVFCVADVSGHGLAPALEMVETRAVLRMLLNEVRPLDETVAALNRLLIGDMPEGMFVTMFLAELDPRSQQFRYVGAGHDAALFRHDGAVERLPSSGVVLGLFEGSTYPLSPALQMQPDDILLIATDGIHETLSPQHELFGSERMRRIVKLRQSLPAAAILNELFSVAHAFSQEPLPRDDMTAILIKALPAAGADEGAKDRVS
ncbi:MAG: SpoIIE family protein phosphatase [Planctomycetaceae bacterium]|nr:SpoIIE family protein phosphatase [Planctomycetaceae bacterium]